MQLTEQGYDASITYETYIQFGKPKIVAAGFSLRVESGSDCYVTEKGAEKIKRILTDKGGNASYQ